MWFFISQIAGTLLDYSKCIECKKKPSKNYNNLRPPYWNAVHYFILLSFRWSLSLRSEKFNFQNKHYKCVGGGKTSTCVSITNAIINGITRNYQNKDLFLNNKNNSNDILLRIRLWSNTYFSSAASFISIRIDPFPEQLTYKNHLNNSNNVLVGRNGKCFMDVFTKGIYHKVEEAKWKVI